MRTAAEAPVLFVNDQPQELAAGTTLFAVLRGLGLAERKGVAAAVNGTVVPRAGWRAQALQNGDRVLLIRATQGG